MPCPAFERDVVTLTLRAPVCLHFNHGGAAMGLLCRAFGQHPVPAAVVPATACTTRACAGARAHRPTGVKSTPAWPGGARPC